MYMKLSNFRQRLFRIAIAAVAVLAILSQPILASELLGVLAEIIRPESDIAKQLDLNDQQREGLKQLNSKRQRAALGLASQLNEIPKSEQLKAKSDFTAESERMVFELLNEPQKAKLAQLRLQWIGLASLGEDEIAKAVNLADWQKEVVAEWREKLREARKQNNLEKVKPQADRALRRELSETQWAAWQLMAGQITETTAGPPQPPERKTTNTVASNNSPSDKTGQPSTAAVSPEQASQMPVDDIKLVLNFQQQPWSVVIKWLADQADLSVQSEVLPPGTFTYRDRSRSYSVSETLDIMNGYLLDSGFTLFRNGRLLRCSNLEDDQEMRGELIAMIADTISVEELKSRKYGRYEPVRVFFTLERVAPDTVLKQVEELLSVQGKAIALETSGQLLVTDMAGNVRNIADFIKRAEDPSAARGAGVQSISLSHISAEEVLAVARPLLELQESVNVSTNIKISTNTFGTMIYAKGDLDKVQIIKDLVEQMDKAPSEAEKPITYEKPYIDKHTVSGLDLQLAYEVVTQMLAGTPDVRLAKDASMKQLILEGRKAEHEMVKRTLESLAGQASDFQVIPLQNLDFQLAVAAIRKFFGLAEKSDPTKGEPVIDGDMIARQIWVKGSKEQVEQIKKLIEDLEKNAKSNKNIWGDKIRMLPPGGNTADALRQAEQMWEQMYGKDNPILRQSGDITSPGGLRSRSLAPPRKPKVTGDDKSPQGDVKPKEETKPEEEAKEPPKKPVSDSITNRIQNPFISASRGLLVSQESENATVQQADGKNAPILIIEGPTGMMITCDDPDALARFENLLRMIMDQSAIGSDEPEVFYLQNIKANAARELLMEVLGGASSSGGGGGGLIGDMATSVLGGLGGGMLGNLLGGGGSSSSASSVGLAAGDFSIVADPRLNALFVSASLPDKKLIEQIIKVIDLPESPFPVETRGVIELIPVVTQDVGDVLNTVKAVLGDRIEGAASRGGAGGGGGQPNPAEFIQAMRSAVGGGGSGRRGGGNSELTEPKIAVSSDSFTNTLIVQAQPQQIEEIRQLVALIDQAGEGEQEEVQVVPIPGGVSSTGLADGLKRVLGPKAQTNTTASTSGSSGSSGSSSSPSSSSSSSSGFDANAARARAEFFQNMMQRGGGTFGSGSGGSPGGTSGGSSRGGDRGSGGGDRGSGRGR
jgi:type II secretory pathway component GspD/PulD (secretin)